MRPGFAFSLSACDGAARSGRLTTPHGVVETHGRRETQALSEGLEVIPRRTIEYKAQMLDEMDLDAVLARKPEIVASVPYFESDIFDLAGLLRLGDQIWR